MKMASSCRSIALLPDCLQKCTLRNEHSTIGQFHRIRFFIEKAYDEKQSSSAIFVELGQAFDTVRHAAFIQKMKEMLPKRYVDILRPNSEGRMFFKVKQDKAHS